MKGVDAGEQLFVTGRPVPLVKNKKYDEHDDYDEVGIHWLK